MTPQEKVAELHEAIAAGNRTLRLFQTQSLPRWRPDPSKPPEENDVPPLAWVSPDDLREADFQPGDYARAGAVVCCPKGNTGVVTRVLPSGIIIEGVKCSCGCEWTRSTVKLEDWKPSWPLKFRMLREYAADLSERQLSQEWAGAHARLVGDQIRGMGVFFFSLYMFVVVSISAAMVTWKKVVHVGKWLACTGLRIHTPAEGYRYETALGRPAFIPVETMPVLPFPDAKLTRFCSVCRCELKP